MPALNFKQRFGPMVERGEKLQTIRKKRKYPIEEGDRLYHYTGQRTKSCRKLGESDCSKVTEIIIDLVDGFPIVILGGQALSRTTIRVLARKDGFRNEFEFCQFFQDTYDETPFCGVLIKWEDIYSEEVMDE